MLSAISFFRSCLYAASNCVEFKNLSQSEQLRVSHSHNNSIIDKIYLSDSIIENIDEDEFVETVQSMQSLWMITNAN